MDIGLEDKCLLLLNLKKFPRWTIVGANFNLVKPNLVELYNIHCNKLPHSK